MKSSMVSHAYFFCENGGRFMSLKVAMDVSKSDSFVKSYTARQGEANDTIQFYLYDNGLRIGNNSIESAKLRAETPQGHYIETNLTKGTNYLELKLTSNMNAEVGYYKRFYLEIKLVSTGEIISTPDLIYFVLPDANISGGNAQDYISRVEEIINKINKLYSDLVISLTDQYNEVVAKLRKELQDAIDDFNVLINGLQTRIDGIDTTLDGIDTLINGLNNQLDNLDAKLQEFLDKFGSSQPLFFRGKMADVDWNTLQTTNDRGIYYVAGIAASADKHTPITSGTMWGQLTVTVEGVVVQSYTDGAIMYQRRLSGSPLTWSNWRKFLTYDTGMNQLSLAMGADDWNNYTEIGTYGITTGTGANAPVNSTGTLLVQGYGTGGSGRTQLFINSNSIRYRQYQGGGNWTTWQTLSNLGNTDSKYMNIVATPVVAQDWNTLTTIGTYSVQSATGANRPSSTETWGTLLVQSNIHNSSMATQLFIGDTNIYFRRKTGATNWNAWRTPTPAVATSTEINTGTDNAKMITAKGLADSQYSKYIKIGEWSPLTFNSGYKSGDGTTLRYRITEYPQADGTVKKYIEFDGAWTTNNDSIPSGGATQQQWAVLPEAIRPAKTKMFPAQCSGFSSTGRVAFVANGICYGAQNTGAAVTYMYVTGMGYWIGE